jgi:hypothetical protein
VKLGRLTLAGVDAFSEWLDQLREDGSAAVPATMLTDPTFSEELGVDIEMEERVFSSRLDAASTLFAAFSGASLSDVEHDRGIWSWLSLFYIDSVCPSQKGFRKPGAQARYIPESHNFQRYYRHLLAGPYRVFRAYRSQPDIALSLLCQPVHKPGDVVEQIAARQERVTNRGVVGIATRLYVEPAGKQLKRGAGGKGAGSVRRLIGLIDQLELTWDMAIAEPSELAAILPKEFEKFAAH